MKFSNRLLAAAGGIAVVAALMMPASASAAEPTNPQAPGGVSASADVAVADQCYKWRQTTGTHDLSHSTYNAPRNYDTPAVWHNIACGKVTIQVPRGQMALVDLSATAELDCASTPTSSPSTGWCEGRILVAGGVSHPDNTGRGDSYAWDSAKGGLYDWSAHALDQERRMICPRSTVTNLPCVYTVQLQTMNTAGANYLWLDDLTLRAVVNYGNTSWTSAAP